MCTSWEAGDHNEQVVLGVADNLHIYGLVFLMVEKKNRSGEGALMRMCVQFIVLDRCMKSSLNKNLLLFIKQDQSIIIRINGFQLT